MTSSFQIPKGCKNMTCIHLLTFSNLYFFHWCHWRKLLQDKLSQFISVNPRTMQIPPTHTRFFVRKCRRALMHPWGREGELFLENSSRYLRRNLPADLFVYFICVLSTACPFLVAAGIWHALLVSQFSNLGPVSVTVCTAALELQEHWIY